MLLLLDSAADVAEAPVDDERALIVNVEPYNVHAAASVGEEGLFWNVLTCCRGRHFAILSRREKEMDSKKDLIFYDLGQEITLFFF